MDNCSTPEPSYVSSMASQLRVLNLMDPRSPTIAFPRTPLQIIMKDSRHILEDGTPVLDTTSSPVSFVSVSSPSNAEDSLNFTDRSNCPYFSLDRKPDVKNIKSSLTNLIISEESVLKCTTNDTDDLEHSMNEVDSIEIILEMHETTPKNKHLKYTPSPSEVVQKSVITSATNTTPLNTKMCDITMNNSIENDSISRNLLKQRSATPTKKRNPLGAVDNICPTTPPSKCQQNIFREKQWKRIQEERKKLGIEVDENVQLPMYDITASAPSKLMLRKSRIHGRFNLQ